MKGNVLILMGSKSDSSYSSLTEKVLRSLGINFQTHILSAHRNLDKLYTFVKNETADFDAIICLAGYAAHLAGVVAGLTLKPVIAVPLPQSELNGIDSILSTVMMPKGAPVAVMSMGNAGAINAALFAARIIGLENNEIIEKIKEASSDMSSLWK